MACAIANDIAEKQGLPLVVISRGIRAKLGQETTPEALEVLSRVGINWQGKSAPLTQDDLAWSDLVWCMTQEHLDYAAELSACLASNLKPQITLLEDEKDITDPLDCGIVAYEDLYESLGHLLLKRLVGLCVP